MEDRYTTTMIQRTRGNSERIMLQEGIFLSGLMDKNKSYFRWGVFSWMVNDLLIYTQLVILVQNVGS